MDLGKKLLFAGGVAYVAVATTLEAAIVLYTGADQGSSAQMVRDVLRQSGDLETLAASEESLAREETSSYWNVWRDCFRSNYQDWKEYLVI